MSLSSLIKFAKVPIELNKEDVEEVVILAKWERTVIARSLSDAAFQMGLKPTLIFLQEGIFLVKGLSEATKAAILESQMVINAAFRMVHTDFMRDVLKRGIKFIGMSEITEDTLTNGAATADYNEVARVTKEVAGILTSASKVKIESDRGTNITFSIHKRRCIELNGIFKPGSIACFPDGEAAIAPIEGTAEGRIIVDGPMEPVGALRGPVVFNLSEGRITSIEGGVEANQIKSFLEKGDVNSCCLGEFAVGTNAKARLSGNVSESKKRLGTIHVAFGDNLTLGGQLKSAIHIDGVINSPTVWVDGKILLDNGKLIY
ncbi:MAG: aminopeptidase [Bacillota bacterium]